MPENPRLQFLLKEIDIIQDSIKNMDDLMFKTQNFSFLLWSGLLYLIAEKLTGNPAYSPLQLQGMKLGTAIIPIAFWGVHYYWQKYLFLMTARQRVITAFLNRPDFHEWAQNEADTSFPVYDPVGWIFTQDHFKEGQGRGPYKGQTYPQDYLVNTRYMSRLKILMHKGAKFYYPLMLLISLLFGFLT